MHTYVHIFTFCGVFLAPKLKLSQSFLSSFTIVWTNRSMVYVQNLVLILQQGTPLFLNAFVPRKALQRRWINVLLQLAQIASGCPSCCLVPASPHPGQWVKWVIFAIYLLYMTHVTPIVFTPVLKGKICCSEAQSPTKSTNLRPNRGNLAIPQSLRLLQFLEVLHIELRFLRFTFRLVLRLIGLLPQKSHRKHPSKTTENHGSHGNLIFPLAPPIRSRNGAAEIWPSQDTAEKRPLVPPRAHAVVMLCWVPGCGNKSTKAI